MKRLLVYLVAAVAAAGLITSACAPAATPTPAKAPAVPVAPTKAPEPTKPAAPGAAPTKAPEATKAPAPTAAPTAVPAKKVDFPTKGRAITVIVPWEPGVGSDIATRILAPFLEKELGTTIEVVNKPGAGSQMGITEGAKARPDGYTLTLFPFIAGLVTYLDADRKAAYDRKSFAPLALYIVDDTVIAVKGEGRYKSTKDLVDAAKAAPDKITYAAAAMSNTDIIALMLEEAAGVRFAHVNVTGGAAGMTAVMGDHVDAFGNSAGSVAAPFKSGQLRILGYGGRQPNQFLPGVKTFAEQGYQVFLDPSNGLAAPAGTPKDVMDVLSAAIKKSVENPELNKKLNDVGQSTRYLDPAQFDAYWADYEKRVAPMVELGKKRQN